MSANGRWHLIRRLKINTQCESPHSVVLSGMFTRAKVASVYRS